VFPYSVAIVYPNLYEGRATLSFTLLTLLLKRIARAI